MGFRFRKSIKLFPGVKVNLSNRGVSTSIGGPGATVNLKPGRKAKVTVGIPGSGLSYSSDIGSNSPSTKSSFGLIGKILFAIFVLYIISTIFSS